MPDNRRFGLIETTTGYVMGDVCMPGDLVDRMSDETLMRHAAVTVMNSADLTRRYDHHEFVPIERRRENVSALDVYEIADDAFELTDGQDREQIAHVEAGRFIGRVRHVSPFDR